MKIDKAQLDFAVSVLEKNNPEAIIIHPESRQKLRRIAIMVLDNIDDIFMVNGNFRAPKPWNVTAIIKLIALVIKIGKAIVEILSEAKVGAPTEEPKRRRTRKIKPSPDEAVVVA